MTGIAELAQRLQVELGKNLPGTEIQWEMASSDRRIPGYPKKKSEDSRLSAVLILLYPAGSVINTVFIQRAVYNGVHSGQIGFPGGKMEDVDNSLVDTALREACEETGICKESARVIGTLTPLFISVSNTEVTPVVAWCDTRPGFKIQPEEVESIIEAPLSYFTSPLNIHEKEMLLGDEMLKVRYFDFNGNIIWGATAMILYELVVILEKASLTSLV